MWSLVIVQVVILSIDIDPHLESIWTEKPLNDLLSVAVWQNCWADDLFEKFIIYQIHECFQTSLLAEMPAFLT